MQKLAYTQITTEKFAYFPVFERKIKMERIMYIYIIRSILSIFRYQGKTGSSGE